jgi:hypothetical protein
MIRIKTEKKSDEKIKIGAAAHADEAQKSWVDDPKLMMATIRNLEREHAGRVGDNRKYQRLYYQKPHTTARVNESTDMEGVKTYDTLRRHGANLTAEVIDAGVALLCRRLQPKILPVGGDNEMQQACKRVGRVLDGVAESSEWLSEFTEVARAGMIGDIGHALIDIDQATDEIKAWKLDSNYVFWPLDATRTPRTIMVVFPVPKAKLIAQFPEHEAAIRTMPTWRPKKVVGVDDLGGSRQNIDTVAVGIGWALASGPKSPGRKVTMGHETVLEDVPYELDIHQVVKYSWKPNANGYAGVPLTRSIAPYDLTNKRLLSRTLAALDGAVPWLLTEEENDVEAVSDIDYQRVTYPRGSAPPQVIVPNPVSTQALDRMEANRASAFREAHINENAAQGQAPAGFKSAVAQFAWADSVQTVLLPQQEAWQKLWRDAAHVVTALLSTSKKVRVRLGDMLEEITLPKLPRDQYQITFGLVSGLALTVSGRLEQLSQIQAALPNKLDNEDVLRHIGLPDTQQLADRLLAPRELAEYIVHCALDDGNIVVPPRMLGPDGLAALYRISSQEYCGALKKPRNYYKRTHLEALRKVILITEFLQKSPLAPAAAAPAAPVEPLPVIPVGPATGGAINPGPAAPPQAVAA